MPTPKITFKNFGEKLQQALMRFPLTVTAVIAFAILMIINIYTHFKNVVDERFFWFLGLTVFFSLAFYLFAENRLSCLLKNLLNILLAGLLAWFSLTLDKPVVEAEIIRILVLCVSFGAAVFFAPFIIGRRPLAFWDYVMNVIYQLIIAGVFAGVLMGGLSLALLSLDELFGMNIPETAYNYLSVLCFIVFFPLYFLSFLPRIDKNEEEKPVDFPKIYKILGLYILLPILSIYILILYVYLAKIIVTWELPNGWVSWLVSILGIVGYLTISLLHPIYLKGENKPAKLFIRYFPVILLPLLILMFVGIMRRFSDYGITINRLFILLLNLWLFGISIYLFISRTKHVKWIYITFAAVAFLSSVGPWSVFSITRHTLKSELSQLLTEANWTNSKDNIITPLNKEKQKRLADVANYLQTNYGANLIRPMFSSLGEKAEVSNLIKALGIKDEQQLKDNYFFVNASESSFEINVADYRKAIQLRKRQDEDLIYKSDSLKISIENGQLKMLQNTIETIISLEPIIEKAASDKKESIDLQNLILENSDYKLIIFNLDGQRKIDNSITISYLNGLLLLK